MTTSASEHYVRAAQGLYGTATGRTVLDHQGWLAITCGVPDSPAVLLRLSYLAVSSVFTVMRLLPVNGTDKDIQILALRHQLVILQRQTDRPRLTGTDRVLLAALLHRLPRIRLRQVALIVSADTILRWHRDLIRRRHAKRSRRNRPGRPPTRRSARALVLRLARENSSWGYRRIHGELVALGISLAPSTVWQILKRHGIQPAPHGDHLAWPAFLRGQAPAITACDFFTATTLTGVTYHVFAVIEHATRRVPILAATAHPTTTWPTQLARNLVMDLQDAGAAVKYLIRDRDTKFTHAFDAVLGTRSVGDGARLSECCARGVGVPCRGQRGLGV